MIGVVYGNWREAGEMTVFNEKPQCGRYGLGRRLACGILLLGLLALSACGLPASSNNLSDATDFQDSDFILQILQVGDASAAIVQSDGATMLVDVGDQDDASKLQSTLESLGVKELEAVILSHGHSDHVGGYQALADYPIEAAYISPQPYDSSVYDGALAMLEQQANIIELPVVGESFQLGSATVQFLGPMQDRYSDVNNSSLVVKIAYGETSFILPGDMEGLAADEMLETFSESELDCDVLVAAHHGSATDNTNSYRLFRALSPECVVISSAGAESEYGFPHDEVLSRISDLPAELYRTDLEGDIVFTSDGAKITVYAAGSENVLAESLPDSGNNPDTSYIGNINSKNCICRLAVVCPRNKIGFIF